MAAAVSALKHHVEEYSRPIDLVHLSRMTLGERSLEREVMQLFARQANLLTARMRTLAPVQAGALAHTLNGSARGIGAWRAARAAEAVECASEEEFAAALRELEDAVAEACAFITDVLRAN